ncbi:MAG: WbqC family protein [Bacteroidales bacterium]|nr:WbqC family protein [Bacteroidales bacterium]
MSTAIFSTAYFAPIPYFVHFRESTNPVIESCEHYIKQTYRNRCMIATANGLMSLSLPIDKSNSEKTAIRDIKISEHGHWQHLHWNSIESAYNSSPFFEYYADDLRPFFERKPGFLFDFNEEIRLKIGELLDLSVEAEHSTEYIREELLPEGWHDFREIIHPKKILAEVDPGFTPKPYYQVFNHKYGFQPNLSIMDLLFNMGPESILYL